MIHELIDSKKKTPRNSHSKNVKVLHDNKLFCENSNFELTDCDNKDAESSTSNFIPPWLRNSLGLNQKSNQNLDWSVCLPNFIALGHTVSDQKSAKTKEQNRNELEAIKTINEQELSKSTYHSHEINERELVIAEVLDDSQPSFDNEKLISILYDNKLQESETGSTYTISKIFKEEEPSVTNSENGRFKDDERRKFKYLKQKTKLRKRLPSEQKTKELDKSEIDILLEIKAKEVLENYMKKDVHSVSSDLKQLEAKLILLNSKCQSSDMSKLSEQEMRLLQEIKTQAGGKEDFERVVEHIKESNLKEMFKNTICSSKTFGEKIKKSETEDKEIKRTKESPQNFRYSDEFKKVPVDKESIASTDDENDIKRFSEFLSKNKNGDEKKKCLEQVRNYFERKRKTRLTKRRYTDETKTPRQVYSSDRKEDFSSEKLKNDDSFIVVPINDKKKIGICDREVVEKAINETLQKFVDLYDFHISPSTMGNMKKNIMQAIQSDSLESNNSKQNSSESNELKGISGDTQICLGKEIPLDIRAESEKKDFSGNFYNAEDIESKPVLHDHVNYENSNKEFKKKNYQSAIEGGGENCIKLSKYESPGNEAAKKLKNEFENFLFSVQAHTDLTGTKLLSVTLEKQERNGTPKNLHYTYNFSKKILESKKIDSECRNSRNCREVETQTSSKTAIKTKSAKIQTIEIRDFCDQGLQTEIKLLVTTSAQTEKDSVTVKELKELNGLDVCPGLYRMVKSKEAGRFYLYPESTDTPDSALFYNKSDSLMKFSETELDKTKDVVTFFGKDKSHKDKRFLKEREGKKSKKTRRGYIVKAGQLRKFRKKESLCLGSQKFHQRRHCLYYKKQNTSKYFSKAESFVGDGVKECTSLSADHTGCVWFWNGEKITPGCDLKPHVEGLLKEKLKEIVSAKNKGLPASNDCCPVLSKLNITSICHVEEKENSERNLQIRNANAVHCFKKSLSSNKKSETFLNESAKSDSRFRIQMKVSSEGREIHESCGSSPENVTVRDASTQNSQQTFLSLNITKGNSRSKLRISKSKYKKNFYLSSTGDNEDSIISLNKNDIMEEFIDSKELTAEFENCRDNEEVTVDSYSTLEDSVSSSTSKIYIEDPLALLLDTKNTTENSEVSLDSKTEETKEISIANSKSQVRSVYDLEEEKVVEGRKSRPETQVESHKHWELIEGVLKSINQKEREIIWNDIRDFIKSKIGRDISDDEAREVCIEIEQDMPKGGMEGDTKSPVFPEGRFSKSEGSTEVEIDLTLEDLERILRQQQQKKVKRRSVNQVEEIRRRKSSNWEGMQNL